ncbi:MAG TPA: hypothetical protein PK640_05630 [Verrucomicrobiota bacterium]|nr:hypothetical protein [Verrucomicrobiota bacterium]
MSTATTRQFRPDSLLRDIASLDRRFRAALGDWRRIDRVRGFGGPNNPYDDFAPRLERLFARARTAVNQGNMNLARDAYAALFATLALKDDYGFAITRPKSISICDEQVRYLRTVGETAPAGKRGAQLTERMHHLRRTLWEQCKLTIGALLESASLTQDVREAWLDELIAALRDDREREADRWLREAVQLRCGAVGLQELARQDSPWRPQAWLDWLESVATHQEPSRLLQSAREALANMPDGLESRAVAADHLASAAQALNDRESLLTARWEAFRAEPFPRRLLDLRDAACGRKAQSQWVLQAVTRACDETGGLIPGPLVCGGMGGDQVLFLEDGDCFASGPTNGTDALALMLTGDWRKTFKMAREDGYPDWVGQMTARAFILPVIMAWLVGWPEHPAPASTASLLDAALDRFDVPEEPEQQVSRRLRSALAEVVPTWKEPAKAGKAIVVNACVRLVRAGVQATFERDYHPHVQDATVLAVATAEVLRAQQSDAAGFEFLDRLTAKYRQHPHFTHELTVCRGQMQRSPIG